MKRNKNLAVNIPADGIQLAVVMDTNKTEEEYRELAGNYVSVYLKDTAVGRMLFNVCYKRTITDSDVFDSVLYNICKNDDGTTKKDKFGNSIRSISTKAKETDMLNNFREMLQRNIDVVKMLIDATKEYEAEAWLSVRMNDHHFPEDAGFNSSVSYNRAEEVGVNKSKIYMDYTSEIIQNYYKEYINELCERYDVDGIELDFLRSAPVMSEVNVQNIKKLNDYIKELRKTVNDIASKKGKMIQLSARVYSTPEHNLSFGIDPVKWIADGLIDVLTVEGWYIPTYYDIPIEEWRNSIKKRNLEEKPYSLLAGTDWAVRCDSTAYSGYKMWITLEQIKGFASAMYNKGADGIYFFNHFMPEGIGAWTYYQNKKGEMVKKNVLKEKLIAAESEKLAETGMRTYVKTCRDYSNDMYPITVKDSVGYTVKMNTAKKPIDGKYTVVVGIDASEGYMGNNLKVFVNGASAKQIDDLSCDGFIWERGKTSEPVALHVSETSPRVMQFVLEDNAGLSDGDNDITLTNVNPAKPQLVKWLEVQVNNEKKE